MIVCCLNGVIKAQGLTESKTRHRQLICTLGIDVIHFAVHEKSVYVYSHSGDETQYEYGPIRQVSIPDTAPSGML